ncbi:MAG TPA: ATP-binding protein [Gemmatimonas sp.]|nr:ATP-binding protein [Gemmatimonas sp.]
MTAINGVIEGVVALCSGAGFSARHCRFNIPVALTEALSNAIIRGNGNDVARCVRVRSQIELAARDRTAGSSGIFATLVVEVTDEGDGFDLATAGSRPDAADWLEREDGRGVFLMQALMDRVECTRGAGAPGNTVRLVLHRT